MSYLDNLIQQVRIDTAWLPPIVIDEPFSASATPNAPSPLLQFLKPKITITPSGMSPVTTTPWGDPGATKWPYVEGTIVIAALIIGAALLSGELTRK